MDARAGAELYIPEHLDRLQHLRQRLLENIPNLVRMLVGLVLKVKLVFFVRLSR